MPALRAPILALAALAVAACSPVFNWRDLRLESSTASLILPCKKPSVASSPVPFADVPTELALAACDAGGATFAVMSTVLPAGHSPDEVLEGWQRATLTNMGADPGSVVRREFRPLGSLPLPHAQRVLAKGKDARGRELTTQAVWAARALEGGRTELLHAIIHARWKQTHEIDVFFENIRWPQR